MEKDTFFVSDLHLGLLSEEIESQKEKKFLDFLSFAEDKIDRLIILGDLFDYWFEYKRVIQKDFIKTLAALTTLSEKGIKIDYFIGNHDFLHKDFFETKVGVKLYNDPITMIINNTKFFLGHGDGLVKNDVGYKILKKIMRNKFIQKVYSLIHPDFGIWLASGTSKKSRDYTNDKDYGQEDGLLETAKLKIEEGFDYVIFGHSHIRKNYQHKNGKYINLGSWLDRPCYGKWDGQSFEVIDWE